MKPDYAGLLDDLTRISLSDDERKSIEQLPKMLNYMFMENMHHSFAFRRLKYAVTEEDIRLHGYSPDEEIFRSTIPEDFLKKYLEKSY